MAFVLHIIPCFKKFLIYTCLNLLKLVGLQKGYVEFGQIWIN